MDIKEYLKSIAKKEHEIEIMQDKADYLRSMASGGSSPRMDDSPRVPKNTGSSMENFVCKAIDLENEIRERQDALEKNKRVILSVLETFSDSELKKLILLRYFEHLGWDDVAEMMHRSSSWVFKAHGEALSQLRRKLEVVA